MRFSSIFKHRLPQREARPAEPARETPPAPDPSGEEDLPELDARVRLVGEWQLGEG